MEEFIQEISLRFLERFLKKMMLINTDWIYPYRKLAVNALRIGNFKVQINQLSLFLIKKQ